MICAAVGIKAWMAKTPCVDEVRPAQCVACEAPSRPVGGPLVLHGHGLLARQVRGVLDVDAQPGVFLLWVRRYACQLCNAVMTVVPDALRELICDIRREHPSASARLIVRTLEADGPS